MAGKVSEVMGMKVSASEAWKVFGTLKFAEIVQQALPDQISKIEVVQGDGGQGTILQAFFTPGAPSPWNKEELIVVDDEKRVKVAKLIEGGYLDMGFTSFQYRWEVIPTAENECIAKGSMEYEAKDEAAAALVSGDPLIAILQTAANYVVQHYNK